MLCCIDRSLGRPEARQFRRLLRLRLLLLRRLLLLLRRLLRLRGALLGRLAWLDERS